MTVARLTRVVVALAALIIATLDAGPAHADTGRHVDRSGDAPAIIDIIAFSVRNDADRVVMSVKVPGLRSRGGFAFEYSASRYGGLYVFVRENGPGPEVSARYCGDVSCHAVHCPGVRGSWSRERHRVRVVIPQRCYPAALPEPGVFSASSGSKSDYDDAGVLRVARG